jgi:hypothetical protein
MAKTITAVDTVAGHFSDLFAAVNSLISIMGTEIVTANSTVAGAGTTGNGFVTGILGGTTLVANTLRGGTVSTTTPLTLGSNTALAVGFNIISGNLTINAASLAIGANWIANSTGLFMGTLAVNTTSVAFGTTSLINTVAWLVGNSVANVTSNSVNFVCANATTKVSILPDSVFIGNSTVNATITAAGLSNVTISALNFGNSTANLIGNSTVLRIANTLGYVNVVPTAIYSGIVTITNTAILVGNSTVNSTTNATLMQVMNATGTANLTPQNLIIGSAIVNSTAFNTGASVVNATNIACGANVYFTTGTVLVGNATSYITSNSTLLQAVSGSGIANLTPTSLVIGAATVNSTVFNIGSWTANGTTVTMGANALLTTAGITVGNSTVNLIANSTTIQTGTVVHNSAGLFVGANIVVNATTIGIGTGRVVSTAQTDTMAVGYTFAPYNLGNMTNFTVNPTLGNYQYGTNHGAVTITAPGADGAVTILITNDATAGAITANSTQGWTIGSTGDAFTTTNGNKFLMNIVRINGVASYIIKALQ